MIVAPHVSVLAGAGASAPLGYSTLVDFETAIANYAPASTAKEKRELAELFRRVRQSLVAQGQSTDFEAILTMFAKYLDLLLTLRVDPFMSGEFLDTVPDRFRYSAFWQKIGQGQDIVDKIILDHYGAMPTREIRALHKLAQFLNPLIFMNGGFLDYFTTNYDLGMEAVGKHSPLSVPLITGLRDPLVIRGKWDSELLNVNIHKRKGLYIHRLHGCVRWFREPASQRWGDDGSIVAHARVPKGDSLCPCVMYPGRKFHVAVQPYCDSFGRLREVLARTRVCLIVGTSFRDNNVMEYIIEANNQRRKPLPIVIVDLMDVRPRFFKRIQEARDLTYFQYNRRQWQVKFIVGDYADEQIQKEILGAIAKPKSIPLSTEPIS